MIDIVQNDDFASFWRTAIRSSKLGFFLRVLKSDSSVELNGAGEARAEAFWLLFDRRLKSGE